MSFAFRPDDRTATAALRRIARAELAAALKRLEAGPDSPEAVHGLRKHTKKLRGLLRLVRPVFPGHDAANAVLRDGARHLANLRDAEVRLATLHGLLADLPGGLPEGAARAALASLGADVAAHRQPQAMAATVAALVADLGALRHDARRWRLKSDGWAALSPGLTATWRAARRRRRAAARAFAAGEDAAPFHDWRKAVKHHWYQARLLEPLWPEMLAPQIAAAEALGEDLGAHNDLDHLLARLAADPDPAVARLARGGPLAEAARAARADLARRSLVAGARLLADRPGALAHRWGVWWGAWKGGA